MTKKKDIINWNLEAALVKKLSLEGQTLQKIGDRYGVSRERIRQVLKKYFPAISSKQRGASALVSKKRREKIESLYARTGRTTSHCPDDLSRAMALCFTRKKQNAKGGKWEWLITPADVVYNLVCPYLDIPLDWFANARAENSPSFDRVDPTKGYIPGNVIVCSWRANRIKNDGTASELRRIADALDNLTLVG